LINFTQNKIKEEVKEIFIKFLAKNMKTQRILNIESNFIDEFLMPLDYAVFLTN